MILVPDSESLREYNSCHNPPGPGGGQFCSKIDPLRIYPQPRYSTEIPDYLRDEVAMAIRAGVVTYHNQQPEPVIDVAGNVVDPLARSYAEPGWKTFVGKQGFSHLAPRGSITITTRGGVWEPMETEYSPDGFPRGKRPKKTNPEMLTDDLKATVEDVESTFKHELGHIMDRSRVGGRIGVELAREIRAWQYAIAITPDHRVSRTMVVRGLESHAYHVFRKAEVLADPETAFLFSRVSTWDLDERLENFVQREYKEGTVREATKAKAKQFAARALKSLDRYAEVLRRKGIVRVPQPVDPFFPTNWRDKIRPGPGGRGWL